MENIKQNKSKLLRYSKQDRRKFPFVYITLLLPVLHLLVFWFYVNVSSIMLAFQDTTEPSLMNNWPFSIASFERVLKDIFSGATHGQGSVRNILKLIGKSMLIWSNAHIVCNIISILTAFMLTKHMIGSRFFRTVYYIPGIVGGVVFSTIMLELYKAGGPIPELLKSWGVELPISATRGGLLASEDTAFITMLLQQFILGIGGGNMIIAGAYMRIPEEIFESARIDGCPFFREVFQIAVPCIWPTISTLMIFGLCSLFVADTSYYLYNPEGMYGMENMGFYLYTLRVGVSNNPNNTWLYGYGAALGIIITLITIPAVYLGRFILSKMNDTIEF